MARQARLLDKAALAAFLLLIPTSAWAGGFVLYEFGAGATGRCGAQTATAEDATILFFNPAAMTRLPGTQLAAGVSLIKPFSSYEAEGKARNPLSIRMGPNGEARQVEVTDGTHDTDQEPALFYPPHLYVTHRLGESLGLGFAFHTPYGLGVDYPRRWDGRYLIKQVNLQTLVFNPNVAVDLAPLLGLSGMHLSLSAGYMAIYGMALLDKNIDLRGLAQYNPGPSFPANEADLDGNVRMEGDGWAHSFNLALHFELPQLLGFGVQYRHPYTLDFEGNAEFTVPSWFSNLSFMGEMLPRFPDTTGKTSMNMPGLINMGVALLAIPNLVLEVDLILEDWRDYEELKLEWACNDAGDKDYNCKIPEEPIAKDWEYNYQVNVGAQYTLSNGLALRLGAGRVGTPVPEETFDPMLPDGERTLLSAGLGYPFTDDLRVDFGYLLAFWEGKKTGEKKKDGTYVNDMGIEEGSAPNGMAVGTYTTSSHIFALTVGAKF
ncbi:MAG: hypothetical protein FJ125_12080 [Deltaproteobacteria bacterium]|nr:hypothetical protein [Deltaproteobacteria bacterium]